MTVTSIQLDGFRKRLVRLYGSEADSALTLLVDVLEAFLDEGDSTSSFGQSDFSSDSLWSENDVVLITYGDQIRPDSGESTTPLQSLAAFLQDWQLPEIINTVHFLPIFPWSSDDGFSVIDYLEIDPAIGDWSDVEEVGQHCELMFDFVMNHVSQHSQWFQSYLAGEAPYDSFFIDVEPGVDVSGVTRPRSLPLLHEFETSRGPKQVWTTFSRDQVDLNYGDPQTLAAAIKVLLEYVRRGARIVRLDAIAYLWKEIGTTCIHLSQTHEVVKLMRDVVSTVAPHVLLLTETNVPHDENVSYFGDGDEAHMVYQFSLPPLVLDAFLHADATPLKSWLRNLEPPRAGTTYFNFTASHDGVGVRPLEGHVEAERLESLVDKVRQRGGRVSMRSHPDGSESPYELNISYVDALADETGNESLQLRRFLSSQALMLSLQGMPAVYFHSLVGTPNDQSGVEESGINRRINRRKYQRSELNQLLGEDGLQRGVFTGMRELIRGRIGQAAFHPDAVQEYIECDDPCVLMLQRTSVDGNQKILIVVNFGETVRSVDLPAGYVGAKSLLRADEGTLASSQLQLQPAQTIWLEGKNN